MDIIKKYINSNQVQVFLILLINYPLCFILYYIKNPFLKQVFIIISGVFLLLFFMGESTLTILLQPLLSFILLYTIPVKFNCIVNLLINITFLTYVHYLRFFSDNGKWLIGQDLPIMINTLKIISIPFLINDGGKEEKDLSHDQKQLSISKKPTILEYFSYILFIPTVIIGPYYEYKTHINYIYNIEDFEENEKIINSNSSKSSLRTKTIFSRTAKAVVYCIVYVIIQKYFNTDMFYQKRDIHLTEFISISLAHTIIYRYLIGWMFTEACFAVCGISYNKRESNYDGIKIVNDTEIVFNPNPITIFNVSIYSIIL